MSMKIKARAEATPNDCPVALIEHLMTRPGGQGEVSQPLNKMFANIPFHKLITNKVARFALSRDQQAFEFMKENGLIRYLTEGKVGEEDLIENDSVHEVGAVIFSKKKFSRFFNREFFILANKRYHHILGRCYNPADKDFKTYGGVGVRVTMTFAEFIVEMEKINFPGKKGESIDRIDPYRHYEPGNMRLVNQQKQVRNRRIVPHILCAGGRVDYLTFFEYHKAHIVGLSADDIRSACKLFDDDVELISHLSQKGFYL